MWSTTTWDHVARSQRVCHVDVLVPNFSKIPIIREWFDKFSRTVFQGRFSQSSVDRTTSNLAKRIESSHRGSQRASYSSDMLLPYASKRGRVATCVENLRQLFRIVNPVQFTEEMDAMCALICLARAPRQPLMFFWWDVARLSVWEMKDSLEKNVQQPNRKHST